AGGGRAPGSPGRARVDRRRGRPRRAPPPGGLPGRGRRAHVALVAGRRRAGAPGGDGARPAGGRRAAPAGAGAGTRPPGAVGAVHEVLAWAGDLEAPPPPAKLVVAGAQARAREVAEACRPDDDEDRLLAVAADQLVVAGPTVVAGYPWFGEWTRDTMTAYEGLLLETGRFEEGRALLLRSAEALSEGMLPNTADSGEGRFDSADGTLWFLH